MKRLPLYFLLSLLALLAAGCAGGPVAAGSTLGQAIQIASGEINGSLREGSTAAVINFNSSSPRLSEYVIEELIGSLVRSGKLVVTDRSNLELIRGEMDFQLSGEVSDESARAIGKKLGAEYIITGSLTPLGAGYRFRVYALNVESAARETATMVTVKDDPELSYLLYADNAVTETRPGASSAASGPAVSSAPPPVRRIPAPGGFVRIEGGSFIMGSPLTEPRRQEDEVPHEVRISAFFMKTHEVTQEEYEAVMGANPSYSKGRNLPVESVSWDDAIEYCNRLSESQKLTPVYTRNGDLVIWNSRANGYRLPTEAEWEYACRAGTTGPFYTGDNITTHEANYNGYRPYNGNAQGSYLNTTMPAGTYPPNPWGLYDMCGNVTEWCWDWFAAYSTAGQTDPQGASMGVRGRTARGGGFRDGGSDQRSAVRYYGETSFRYRELGFRLARSAR